VEESKQEQNKKRNRSLFIYVSLGLLIFFGVQRYNQTINAPENSTFSEFQTQINQGLVTEATIKEQSNTVEYKLENNDSLYVANEVNIKTKWRVTSTFYLLGKIEKIYVLATGESKKNILKSVNVDNDLPINLLKNWKNTSTDT